MSVLDELDPPTRELLERFGFDAVQFDELRERVARGELTSASNVVRGPVESPTADDLVALPTPGSREHDEAHAAGVAALRSGQVAHVVLAGGMATRFGGVVKGVVEVLGGRSFLELALTRTARLADDVGARIPTAVMTSFATDDVVRAHVASLDVEQPLFFSQFVSLRLDRDGGLLRDASGAVSPYGPGHGDLLDALRTSGTLARLRSVGVEHLVVTNVDNLGAVVDPAVIGVHVQEARPLTMEVARKEGDMGGAPARVDGRLRLVEAPCFPPDFDQDTIPVFNTNTAVVAATAIAEPVPLSWLYVEKQVDGIVAVQLERLYHELSAHVDTTYLEVPRDGPTGRFLPVKTPEDLERARPGLEHLLGL